MYKHILIPTDGSPHSLEAARVANTFAEMGDTEQITILHVAPFITTGYYDLTGDLYEAMYERSRIAGGIILEKTREAVNPGPRINTVFEFGTPIAEKICEYAEKNGCDLIVIGSRGMTPVSSFVLGSVSTRVINLSHCPVLVAKMKVKSKNKE
ncbi:MAG: universal stress protein [Syntrophomonadaceae bacterium]|jgi:nucleotide-binding universal stress UspA family protein